MSNVSPEEAQQLEALKGHRLGPYMSFNPVSATQIWQWCSAMGDNNPRYLPGENQIAPPAMMQMWTMRDINDRYAPGSTDAAPFQIFDDMKAMGYPANVAVSYDISFERYLRVMDRPRHYTTIVAITDQKTTGLGVGYFVTERVEYLTQDEQLFAEALITYFQYQPALHSAPGKASSDDRVTLGKESAGRSPFAASQEYWQPDFADIDFASLVVGDKLPELAIPITHKLIVGAAIATQDFIPVHHNVQAAQEAAMPDIFMNILTTCGLSARYLSDWAGAGSCLRKLKFNLMAPNLPGDVMVLQGEVMEIAAANSGGEVVVDFDGSNSKGHHVRGTAILALPGIDTIQ